MNKILDSFLHLAITKRDLQNAVGNDLFNVKCDQPRAVFCENVIAAIQKLLTKEVSVDTIIKWVNVLWFTDLFYFADEDADSIVSVFSVLETMDEDGVKISIDDFMRMIEALRKNVEYTHKR